MQPIVVTLWQPHWAFDRFPLKVLDDPQGAWEAPDQVQTIAPKGWSTAGSELAGWLKNFPLTSDQISSMLGKVQGADKGNEQAGVQQWISETSRWSTRGSAERTADLPLDTDLRRPLIGDLD